MAFTPVNDGDLAVAPQLQQVIDALQGVSGAGQPISLTSMESDDDYALLVQNLGTGGTAQFLDSSGNVLLDLTDAGLEFGAISAITSSSTAYAGFFQNTYSAGVESVAIATAGTGYSNSFAVTFTGGGGSGATGTATASGGAIQSVTITNAGTGYTSVPTPVFTAGGGSGGTGIAALVTIKALVVKSRDGSSDILKIGTQHGSDPFFSMNLQNAILPAASNFLITVKKGTDWVTADFGMEVDGAGDNGATRASIAQRVANTGAVSMRAGEFHASKLLPAGAGGIVGVQIGLHNEYASDTYDQSAGIYLTSDDILGITSGQGHRNGTGILIGGNNGWQYAWRYYNLDGSTVLADVDQTGLGRFRGVNPLDSTADTLGTGVAPWVTTVTKFVTLATTGTPGAPNASRHGVGTAGWYVGAGSTTGLTVGASDYAELSTSGLSVEKALIPKEIADAASPSSTYQKIWASSVDGYVLNKTSAGLVRGVATNDRERFIAALLAIVGDCRWLWLPKSTETTTSIDESLTGRIATYDATIAARLSRLGLGYAVSFNGSTQYATTPDTANLTFGTGAADTAFSIVALVNATNTANNRQIMSKYQTSNIEWYCLVDTGDNLSLGVADDSAAVVSTLTSNSAITQGAWKLFGATYAGTGGASAMNGAALYQDGVAIASTASNNASYVAMENKSGLGQLGASLAASQTWEGSMAMVLLCQTNLTASQHWAIKRLVNWYFALSL